MRRLLFLLSMIATQPSAAQTTLALLHGTAEMSGHSRNASQQTAFLPDHPGQWSLALTHARGRVRFSLEFGHTRADLTLRGTGTAIVTRDVLHAWSGTIEAGRTIAARRGAAVLHAGLGLLLERWEFDLGADDPRWRASARGTLQLDVTLTARLKGVVRGELTAGPSIFRRAELPEGYQPRLGWRRGLSLGLAWTPLNLEP